MNSKYLKIVLIMLFVQILVLADLKEEILNLTGGKRTKLVWIQGSAIKGFDTQTGKETTILDGLSKPGRPFVTRDGNRVVFHTGGKESGIKDFGSLHKTHIVDWEGKNKRELTSDGYLSSIWYDGDRGYAIVMQSNMGVFEKIPFDGGAPPVTILEGSGGRAELQLSGDGRRACHGMGGTGWVDFQESPPKIHDGYGGCRPSISPDDSYRWFRFYNSHSKVKMFDKSGKSWDVTLPKANGEGYYPRWSNNPRYMTHTGDGKYSKAYFCQFADDYKSIQASVLIASGGSIYHPTARVGISGEGTTIIRINPVAGGQKPEREKQFLINGRIFPGLHSLKVLDLP